MDIEQSEMIPPSGNPPTPHGYGEVKKEGALGGGLSPPPTLQINNVSNKNYLSFAFSTQRVKFFD